MTRNKQKTYVDYQPDIDIQLPLRRLSGEEWDSLASTLNTLVMVNLSNRDELDTQIDRGNALYEMRPAQGNNDTPYPGSANIMVPLIASVVDEFTSRISGSSLLPRPLLVRGNDPVAVDQAHLVEQMYNSKYEENEWEDKARTCIHLAARDGTSVMGVFWKEEVRERTFKANTPMPDGTMSKQTQRVREVTYKDPYLVPIELRDFMLFPTYARSIKEADAVSHKIYMGENALNGMVNSGTLDGEMVEKALRYTNTAQGDLTYSKQGYSTYEINNRIEVSDTSVGHPVGISMSRGPISIWKIHTSLFDMDGDGVQEENVFWFHEISATLLGWEPYQYWGDRPYFECVPAPRPNRFYGFSIPERIQALQEEADVQHLTRLEILDRVLNPTYLKRPGSKISAEEQKLGVLNVITTQNKDDVSILEMPSVPPESIQEEQLLMQYAERVVGAPQTPGMSSPSGSTSQSSMGSRNSARAAQQNAAIQGMQTNTIISRMRSWMLKIFKFAHLLTKQYGDDQLSAVSMSGGNTKRIKVPREVLYLDFTLTIAGQGGPLDKETRRQEWQVLYPLLMQNPLLVGNLRRIYGLTASILETFEVPEVTRIIGTLEEADQQQQAQAQAQQQQQQQQLLEAALTHAKVGSNGQTNQGGSR